MAFAGIAALTAKILVSDDIDFPFDQFSRKLSYMIPFVLVTILFSLNNNSGLNCSIPPDSQLNTSSVSVNRPYRNTHAELKYVNSLCKQSKWLKINSSTLHQGGSFSDEKIPVNMTNLICYFMMSLIVIQVGIFTWYSTMVRSSLMPFMRDAKKIMKTEYEIDGRTGQEGQEQKQHGHQENKTEESQTKPKQKKKGFQENETVQGSDQSQIKTTKNNKKAQEREKKGKGEEKERNMKTANEALELIKLRFHTLRDDTIYDAYIVKTTVSIVLHIGGIIGLLIIIFLEYHEQIICKPVADPALPNKVYYCVLSYASLSWHFAIVSVFVQMVSLVLIMFSVCIILPSSTTLMTFRRRIAHMLDTDLISKYRAQSLDYIDRKEKKDYIEIVMIQHPNKFKSFYFCLALIYKNIDENACFWIFNSFFDFFLDNFLVIKKEKSGLPYDMYFEKTKLKDDENSGKRSLAAAAKPWESKYKYTELKDKIHDFLFEDKTFNIPKTRKWEEIKHDVNDTNRKKIENAKEYVKYWENKNPLWPRDFGVISQILSKTICLVSEETQKVHSIFPSPESQAKQKTKCAQGCCLEMCTRMPKDAQLPKDAVYISFQRSEKNKNMLFYNPLKRWESPTKVNSDVEIGEPKPNGQVQPGEDPPGQDPPEQAPQKQPLLVQAPPGQQSNEGNPKPIFKNIYTDVFPMLERDRSYLTNPVLTKVDLCKDRVSEEESEGTCNQREEDIVTVVFKIHIEIGNSPQKYFAIKSHLNEDVKVFKSKFLEVQQKDIKKVEEDLIEKINMNDSSQLEEFEKCLSFSYGKKFQHSSDKKKDYIKFLKSRVFWSLTEIGLACWLFDINIHIIDEELNVQEDKLKMKARNKQKQQRSLVASSSDDQLFSIGPLFSENEGTQPSSEPAAQEIEGKTEKEKETEQIEKAKKSRYKFSRQAREIPVTSSLEAAPTAGHLTERPKNKDPIYLLFRNDLNHFDIGSIQ